MSPSSKLSALYVATYGHPPSSHSMEALIRMEELFGLEQNDPFARMMIALLHSADRFDAAVGRRTERERAFVDELDGLMHGLTNLVGRVDAVGTNAARKATVRNFRLGDGDLVPVHRSVSPLFAYLRYGFYGNPARSRKTSGSALRGGTSSVLPRCSAPCWSSRRSSGGY